MSMFPFVTIFVRKLETLFFRFIDSGVITKQYLSTYANICLKTVFLRLIKIHHFRASMSGSKEGVAFANPLRRRRI